MGSTYVSSSTTTSNTTQNDITLNQEMDLSELAKSVTESATIQTDAQKALEADRLDLFNSLGTALQKNLTGIIEIIQHDYEKTIKVVLVIGLIFLIKD